MTDETGAVQQPEHNKQDWYEILVEGQFHLCWFSGLDEWEISPLPNGNTLLSGPVIDQPALHGLFTRVRDMNLKILSLRLINCIPSDESGKRGNRDERNT